MSGRIELFQVGISAVSLAAVVTDLIWGRIFNWLTMGALALGLAYSFGTGGWSGLGLAFLGAGAGMLLYGWMFFFKAMGGGDVKLLMALGAWGGPRYAAEVALLGVFCGAVLAVILLLARGKLLNLARRIYRFVYSLLVPHLEIEMVKVDQKQTMPFGVPIAAAAIWVAFAPPHVLERLWGI